jgi:serine/threonine protein kinase
MHVLPQFDASDIQKIRELGKGGQALVDLTEWKGKAYARKLWDPAIDSDAIAHEVARITQQKHPCIISVHAFNVPDDTCESCTALFEYAVRGDIGKSVDFLNLEEKSAAIANLIGGLKYLHENDIIHGAVKPGNLLLTGQGVAKLADFGSVRMSGESTRRPMTENYAAPETLQSQRVVKESDIFCAGLAIFFIITKQHFTKAGTS